MIAAPTTDEAEATPANVSDDKSDASREPTAAPAATPIPPSTCAPARTPTIRRCALAWLTIVDSTVVVVVTVLR